MFFAVVGIDSPTLPHLTQQENYSLPSPLVFLLSGWQVYREWGVEPSPKTAKSVPFFTYSFSMLAEIELPTL
jgi:hypothetical protein